MSFRSRCVSEAAKKTKPRPPKAESDKVATSLMGCQMNSSPNSVTQTPGMQPATKRASDADAMQ